MSETMMTDDLRQILLSADSDSLHKLISNEHPADIAALLPDFSSAEIGTLLVMMPLAVRADVIGYFSIDQQAEIVLTLDQDILIELIREMPNDERADLFNQLPLEKQQQLLTSMRKAERDDIFKLASYSEDKVGSIMTSDYAVVDAKMTATQGIAFLRKTGADKETIYQAFVVDSGRRLIGTVSLRELIMADPEEKISAFMTTDPVSIHADEPQEEAARLISRYDLLALPVINGGDKLVGIVTYDDAMDVAEEEATEDIHKSATVGKLDTSLRAASPMSLYRSRVSWLVVLVFANIFTGASIAYFEETIATHLALLFFMPLLVASAGNAGSQSATLMVRGLATGDVSGKDWLQLLGKEVLVAGALGLTMAFAVMAVGVLRAGVDIAVVVALTMIIVVLVGSLIGLGLPFLLEKFGCDPATASTPLITTIADVCGVLIYFGIASWYLREAIQVVV
ncbi:MAG: magnesium transporter [Desulfuromonadales bacterium]|nr:magnesium transporter [Desulfuromonadales bacterium]